MAGSNLVHRPLTWATVLFAQILVFALIYSWNADHFLQSSARDERAAFVAESRIEDELSEILVDNCDSLELDAAFGSACDFIVAVRPSESIGFSVSLISRRGGSLSGTMIRWQTRDRNGVTLGGFEGTVNQTNLEDGSPVPGGLGTGAGLQLDFTVSAALAEDLDSLQSVYEGRAGNRTGLFGRMLYFSIVTTTTLGYGDIVPTTNLSRFLVAFQAISGLVLMGLWVSAIASRSR